MQATRTGSTRVNGQSSARKPLHWNLCCSVRLSVSSLALARATGVHHRWPRDHRFSVFLPERSGQDRSSKNCAGRANPNGRAALGVWFISQNALQGHRDACRWNGQEEKWRMTNFGNVAPCRALEPAAPGYRMPGWMRTVTGQARGRSAKASWNAGALSATARSDRRTGCSRRDRTPSTRRPPLTPLRSRPGRRRRRGAREAHGSRCCADSR